jgi:hypothetical protein
MLSSSVFDNQGKVYDVSRILTADFLFDEESFKKYSPIYLPVTYFLSYAVQFAGLTALVTHTLFFHGKDIWQQSVQPFKSIASIKENGFQNLSIPTTPTGDEISHTHIQTPTHTEFHASIRRRQGMGDVHNRLMERYDDVPISWYISTLLCMVAIAIFVVE